MAVEYAKVRMQFGRPIGSFQAVKHRCADMLRNTEQARAAAYEAAIALESGDRSAPLVGAIAKAYCTHAAAEVTAANVHVHGGIGYTWEHPAHLYYRRAASNEELFGSSRYQRRRVLQEMEI
jgi:alkylation response protein AidB-like acyl-CoA dehydrogenase